VPEHRTPADWITGSDMTTFNTELFRDENPGVFKTHPQQVIRWQSQNAALVKKFADSHDRPGAKRTVYYNDPDLTPGGGNGYEVRLELMMIELPGGGLSDLTNPAGLNQNAGLPEGRLLTDQGQFVQGLELQNNLYGWCFDAYYDGVTNRITDDDPVETLNTGDWFWVIRAGFIEVKLGEEGANDGGVNFGDLLVSDGDPTHGEAGRLRASRGQQGENDWDSDLTVSSAAGPTGGAEVHDVPLVVPGGTLKAGDRLRFSASGIVISDNGADTVRFAMLFDGNVLGESQIIDAAANDVWAIQGEIEVIDGNNCRVVGVGSLVAADGVLAANWVIGTDLGGLDFTLDQALETGVTFSAADPGNTSQQESINYSVARIGVELRPNLLLGTAFDSTGGENDLFPAKVDIQQYGAEITNVIYP